MGYQGASSDGPFCGLCRQQRYVNEVIDYLTLRCHGIRMLTDPLSLDGVVEVHPGPMDIIYTANVEIGEPPQIVKLAMDTGSADL